MKCKSILLLPLASLLLGGCDFEFIKISDAKSSESSQVEEKDSSPSTSEDPSGGSTVDPTVDPTEGEGTETVTKYKVTFDPGRGSGSMEPVEVEEGFSYILPKCGFAAPLGEYFVCWADEDNLTWKPGKEYRISEDTTFTAIYDKSGVNVYTVSFNSNGGSGTMASIDVEEGLYELPSCIFAAPEGKVFDYWSIPGSTTKYQAENFINVTGNVTVTANWKNAVAQIYSITYIPNGGSGTIKPTTGEENSWVYLEYCTFTAPSGKEFDAWEVDGVNRAEHSAIKLTKDFTAKAIWKDKTSEDEGDDDYTLVDLDCGYKNVGIPDNKDNPVEVRTTLSADSTSWFNTSFDGTSDSNGYRSIYGNNAQANLSTYANGNLKIDDKGKGFGTPYFTHSGNKIEIRIGIGETHGTSTSPTDTKKDVFRIYFFGATNNLLGQINIGGTEINQNTTEIKRYYQESNASQVRYFEFRCNERPHNTSGKYMNVGISYCNIKSWERI